MKRPEQCQGRFDPKVRQYDLTNDRDLDEYLLDPAAGGYYKVDPRLTMPLWVWEELNQVHAVNYHLYPRDYPQWLKYPERVLIYQTAESGLRRHFLRVSRPR